MSKSVTTGHEVTVAREPAPQPDEIRRQLQQILASPVFHGSKRCQQFLEYVCVKSLAGEAGALKERTVAVEVFGRPPHIDLGEDTIVRVGAREVRKRLAQYQELSRHNPDYLNALWLDDMTRLYTRMKDAGRIELLDHYLTSEGLTITQFPLQKGKK